MIREVRAKSILNRSSIGDYVINPYVGCQHACIYCYAQFYARRWGRTEPWGSYVEVKVNAPELLAREIERKRKGIVYLSSMTDPYQPVEREYELTRRLLDILRERDWPVLVQTKSPLVLRDADILGGFGQARVGMTIVTLKEEVRRVVEPGAPGVDERIQALEELKEQGIGTFAFIGPILPGTSVEEVLELVSALRGKADVLYFDRLNVKPGLKSKLDTAMRRLGVGNWDRDLDSYYRRMKARLTEELGSTGMRYVFVY
ncbi:MAG: radical SAM protein [Candidatus Korarchaeota archaeon]|nr:radical SAM protein [Candidatus Korarchaeota archaeon]